LPKVLSKTKLSEARSRKLFLHLTLLSALSALILVALGITYAKQISGPSLVVIPIILTVYALTLAYAGGLCWEADGASKAQRERILHEADNITFWAWVVQMIGILGTVFGFWHILAKGGTDADLHARILDGGGVALTGTFVGVYCSIVLSRAYRMIEHDLRG